MAYYWEKEILVLGCGNVLFGDDGFGPAVVEYYDAHFETPPHAEVINTGISVREVLFNVTLGGRKPRKIVIIDAVDAGKPAGEVFDLDVMDLPEKKIDDFSMHQMPTSNLLRELKEMGDVDVQIICVQVQYIPEEVAMGLSDAVKAAIPGVCERIKEILG